MKQTLKDAIKESLFENKKLAKPLVESPEPAEVQVEEPKAATEEPVEVAKPEPPRVLYLAFDPTPAYAQKQQGEDKYRFTNRRWYGCSVYVPFAEYCSLLIQSTDPVDRIVGYKHLGDSFLVNRDTVQLSEGELEIANAAHKIATQLFDGGALWPLAMIPIRVAGPFGSMVLENHYVPSCGYRGNEVLDVFVEYMKNPESWLAKSRRETEVLVEQIRSGWAAPVRGY